MKPCSIQALSRGDAAGIVGMVDRRGRRVLSGLIEHGELISRSSRAPVRLDFPVALDARVVL
jgi:hypothetical protein